MSRSDIDQNFFSINGLCRVCARKASNMNNLYESVHSGKYLLDMLEFCLQRFIPNGDRYPSNICFNCTTNLITAYEFRMLCNASEEHFLLSLEKVLPMDDGSLTQLTITEPSEDSYKENEIKTEVVDTEIYQNQQNFIYCSALEAVESHYDESPCDEGNNHGSKKWKHRPSISSVNDNFMEKSSRKKQTDETSHPIATKTYECYKCRETFQRVGHLRRHLSCRHANQKLFECSDCKKQFVYIKSLFRHRHKHTSQIHDCEICSQSFDSLRNLKSHCFETHKDQLYKCDLCSWKFPLKAQLEIHTQKHKKQERQTCNICNEVFVTAIQLKGHIRDVHTSHLCSECGKTFKTIHLLASHQMLHKSEKPFACALCPSKFKWKAALTLHMSTHTGERNHVCETCSSSFTTRSSLKNHIRIHKGERAFACDSCSMRCYTKYHLTRHKRTHSGEKPYKCTYCDRSYGQNADLNKHLRSHIGANTYQCDQCPKNFRLQVELRKHQCEHYVDKCA